MRVEFSLFARESKSFKQSFQIRLDVAECFKVTFHAGPQHLRRPPVWENADAPKRKIEGGMLRGSASHLCADLRHLVRRDVAEELEGQMNIFRPHRPQPTDIRSPKDFGQLRQGLLSVFREVYGYEGADRVSQCP